GTGKMPRSNHAGRRGTSLFADRRKQHGTKHEDGHPADRHSPHELCGRRPKTPTKQTKREVAANSVHSSLKEENHENGGLDPISRWMVVRRRVCQPQPAAL